MSLRRLLPSLAVLTATVFAGYGAMLSVLLPAQVARIAPADKVAALALVTSISFAVTVFAQPLIGALSDRTRSPLGRRAPWLLGGAAVSAGLLLAIGHADALLWLVVGWAALQFALNGVDIAASSFLIDRIPRSRRGLGASVFAAAAIIGAGAGAVLVGPLAGDPALAGTILAGVLVAVVVDFVLANREPSGAPLEHQERSRWTPRSLDPRRHPAFSWLLASRLLFTLGYQGVYGYLLYIVTDHVGVPERDAPALVGALTATAVVAIVAAAALGGLLSDRMRSRKAFVLLAGCLSVALAFVIPLAVPTIGGMFALAALQGIGFGLYSVAGLAWASEVLPGGERRRGARPRPAQRGDERRPGWRPAHRGCRHRVGRLPDAVHRGHRRRAARSTATVSASSRELTPSLR